MKHPFRSVPTSARTALRVRFGLDPKKRRSLLACISALITALSVELAWPFTPSPAAAFALHTCGGMANFQWHLARPPLTYVEWHNNDAPLEEARRAVRPSGWDVDLRPLHPFPHREYSWSAPDSDRLVNDV